MTMELEQEPCDDAISRQAALKVMCDKCPMYNCISSCSSFKSIKQLPSVTPKNGGLDKARAEIDEHIEYNMRMNYMGIVSGLALAKDVLNKYMAESDEKEATDGTGNS